MVNKPKLNQPDVEITTTFNDINIPESLNVNIIIPSDMMKDFISQQSIVDFKRNHIELNHQKYGNIKIAQDVITYNDKVYTAIKSQPTFSECIKKWEEKGYAILNRKPELTIESEKYDLCIRICKANLIYEISNYYEDKSAFMSPELHQLLTQTLKSLEIENGKEI